MKKLIPALLTLCAFGIGSASAFNIITGSEIEFDSPDDLLLDAATNVIAVDSFGNADSVVNGVRFFTDRTGLGAAVTAEGVVSSGGVTVTTGLVNQIDNWAAAPAFTGGTAGSATALAGVMQDIRWANAGAGQTLNVAITGLAPSTLYNIQLLFNEGADRDRRWDIGVNGVLVVDDWTSEGSGVYTTSNSFAYSADLLTDGAGAFNIIMGQEPLPGDPNNTPFTGADNNAILQGIVVHIPEPSTAALLGLSAFALLTRRRRR